MNQIITVGGELEMLKTSPACSAIVRQHGFGLRQDSSILGNDGRALPRNGPNAPVEIVTGILKAKADLDANGSDTKFDTRDALSTIEKLAECASSVNSTCGFHIHLGRPNGKDSSWNPQRNFGVIGGPASEWQPAKIRAWLAIGLALENRVFDVVPESRRVSKHCRRITDVYSDQQIQSYVPVDASSSRKHDNAQRYCWMNLIETRRKADPCEERVGYARSVPYGTVEIRALGETSDPNYISAWSNLWIKVAFAVAYLPSDQAILRCVHGSYLNSDFEVLEKFKSNHERVHAKTNRSITHAPHVAVAPAFEE